MSNQGQGPKTFTIIVNAREHKVDDGLVSFEQVVLLAYPTPPQGENVLFTITYRNAEGGADGQLMPGQSITVKNGTHFNVRVTDKS